MCIIFSNIALNSLTKQWVIHLCTELFIYLFIHLLLAWSVDWYICLNTVYSAGVGPPFWKVTNVRVRVGLRLGSVLELVYHLLSKTGFLWPLEMADLIHTLVWYWWCVCVGSSRTHDSVHGTAGFWLLRYCSLCLCHLFLSALS